MPQQVIVRQREPLCHACLQESVEARVRTALRGDGLVRPGDCVVAAVSGGPCSAVLLHALCAMRASGASRHPEKRKVPFALHIVHVDERGAFGDGAMAAGGADAVGESVARYLTPADAPLRVTYERVAAGRGAAGRALRKALDAIGDPAARDDALRAARLRLLADAARRAGASALLLGSSGTRLAAEALAECCKGRGADVALVARLVDDRRGPLRVLRPLRACSSRELACCAAALRLPLAQGAPLRALCRRPARNVNLLVEDFVLALLQANPSAVSNIHSVLDKLAVGPLGDGQPLCALCDAPLRVEGVQMDASEAGAADHRADRQVCALCLAAVGPQLAADSLAAILPALGVPESAPEPQPLRHVPSDELRSSIAEFLLDEPEDARAPE
ncbi:hypothetical protein QBZ16_000972 [Prototheca wickerhamii]|uniref:Cytoplasmic tRNA 2-thiolation protein 2 n=1 Tax=Prototheca wickerhamii TaxID=3111 RepID=A0AAD9IHQ9_PROWI|nr:hypothetical protein QBZ16_000972 [Prototheca wickerhamii]